MLGLDGPGGLDPVHPRHRYVDDRHVGEKPTGQLDRLRAVRGFTDDLDVVLALEDLSGALSDQRVIIRDEHADALTHARKRSSDQPRGTSWSLCHRAYTPYAKPPTGGCARTRQNGGSPALSRGRRGADHAKETDD